ncbi:MAG: protein-disulfide reductase DsbD domain-containing protein [Terriglobales bacterium]
MLVISSPTHASTSKASAPHAKVSLISEHAAFVPGQETWLGIQFQLEPGWHIYWLNPGDSGVPPRVTWNLSPGLTMGEIQWPVPERITAPSVTDYGYSQSVLLMAPLSAVAAPGPQLADIGADVRWLVCRELCLPGQAKLQLTLPVAAVASLNPETQELFTAARERWPKPIPDRWKLTARSDKDDFVVTIATGHPEPGADFFPSSPGQIDNLTPPAVRATPQGAELRLKKSDQLVSDISTLQGIVLLNERPAAAYLANVSVEPAPAAKGGAAGFSSLPLIIAFAFLGGAILNLMPCVFPVLSLKAIGLLQSRGEGRSELRKHGLAYAAGVLCSVWLLLGVLLLLRAAGRQIGWGFQLQSQTFVVSLAAFLFLMGLSLAGLFEIGMSWMGLGSSLASHSGCAGSFFTGVLATIVATPCTAPFMGTAVGFALGQSSPLAFAVFTLLAFGLAAPYLLLSFFPQWSRVLPKPGRWMETARQAMAFPLFAAVIWLVWVFGQQAGMNAAVRLLCGLLLIAIAGWLLGRLRRSMLVLTTVTFLFAFSIWFPLHGEQGTAGTNAEAQASNSHGLQWEPFSAERVQQYRDEGKPVFVDFTAAWCLTCQVNERTVFSSQAVQEKLRHNGVALLRADWTSYDPVITQTLAGFGRSGVPFYLLYGKDANAQPRPLPELLTPQIVLNALDQLN